MKMSKNSIIFFILISFLSIALVACGSGNNDSDSSTGTGAEGGILIIDEMSDAVSMDPHGSNDATSANVYYNIYETLVVQDMEMNLQPGLATEWFQDEEDPTRWEFSLREGVKFHDGSDFNADVVKANLDRVLDSDIGSPRAFLYNMITEINILDEYTVEFITEYPYAPLAANLAHNGGSMMSAELIQADYDAVENNGRDYGAVINEGPIGTGYFKFENWTPGEELNLTRNEDYWGEKAKLDGVKFRVISEAATRVANLRTGSSHISHPISPSNIGEVEATPELELIRTPSVSLSYFGFNMDKEPFDDVRVRQAISMAINKDDIIYGIYEGAGIPAISPVPPSVFGYSDNVEGLEYNVDRAKELLAEAGYENGFSTTIWTNDSPERYDAAINVQAQLKEIGIDVEIVQREWGAYLSQTTNGEHDMFVLGWSTVTGDADYSMYALFHSSQHGAPGNRTFIANDELDELLEQARRSSDEQERIELYERAQEILVEEAPMIYVHHQEYLLSHRSEVQGLLQTPTDILLLNEVTIN
ncbi:glutathione ABC transporter substrate-binding protein [Alkalihalobacillus pseudalcaliphilus]|uniref:glutathione ABC transporter substrate-binding protein n=1 Tax=Alkalihalobacillus pseudalcaliphilus TaxID=79884 RepID=UPI00064D7EC5|nr:glutathione ABC transporter substrate-binding protein [Alkalihalobacillus pseudalcaliphilus]KMK74449.1 ABC transporter substrate-binding protein [Alkalihalobacillus pseudalcaliphilus]